MDTKEKLEVIKQHYQLIIRHNQAFDLFMRMADKCKLFDPGQSLNWLKLAEEEIILSKQLLDIANKLFLEL